MVLAPPVTIRVAGTKAGIREAAAAFERFRTSRTLDDESTWPVLVALDEILANIVGHAYAGRSDGVIDLTLALPEPDTEAPLEARQPGGLGIHLVKRLMQDAHYARDNGRNRLVIVRHLPPHATAGPVKE
jgi:serine/threonine-protein kinase RsbW